MKDRHYFDETESKNIFSKSQFHLHSGVMLISLLVAYSR